MSDLLSSAIAAARARAEEGADDGAATRLRIRETLAQRGGASRKRWTLLAAVIGTLFGSTAFALHQGYEPFASPLAVIESAVAPPSTTPADHVAAPKRARAAASVQVAANAPAAPASAPEVPSAVAPSPTAGTAPEPSVSPAAPRPDASARGPVAPPVSASSIPAQERRAVSASPRPAAPARVAKVEPEPASSLPAPSAPKLTSEVPVSIPEPAPLAPEPDGELAAYRVAHTAHFRGGDPVAALAAWDAYLAKFPTGRMALDARYDRALVLVKLQRWAAAREALAPFAAPNSTYRRAEAIRLLDAIRTR